MEKEKNKYAKRGVLAVALTGVLIGVGLGAKAVTRKVKEKNEKRRELNQLRELENEQFGDE